MSLRVTMLGSGTSTGVPVIGCTCAVCRSDNPRNKRWRVGLKLEMGPDVVLVDTPTDLRAQALRFGLPRVDAVLFTHAHADHVFGLDDVRIFNFRQQSAIPCYGSEATLARIRRMFSYVFEAGQEGGGKPQLELIPVAAPFQLLGRTVVPVPVWHGELPVYGYRIGSFAYVTDANRIPEESFRLLAGVEPDLDGVPVFGAELLSSAFIGRLVEHKGWRGVRIYADTVKLRMHAERIVSDDPELHLPEHALLADALSSAYGADAAAPSRA